MWTSPDGITWSRVPHEVAVGVVSGELREFEPNCDGKRWADGVEVMRSVTVGGPGLVAVGLSGFASWGGMPRCGLLRYTAMTTLPLAWCPSMWATALAVSLNG